MRARTLTFPAAEILARTLRSKLVKASGVVLSASVLSGVMNVVAIILTIRHLSPEAFGVLTVALTTMQLVGMLSNVGLNETLMTMLSRAGGAQRTNEVVQSLSAILRLRLIVTAVVVIGGFLFTRPIADGVFRQPELAFPLSLGVLGACGVSLYQFGLTTLQAFGAYTRHAAVVLVRFTAILGAVVLVARMGQLDLSAALAINVGAPFLAFAVSLSFASVRVLSGGGNLLELLHRIWDLSKWVVVSNLCSMFFSRLEIYLLTAFASPVELGIYSAAFKLCGGILLLEVAIRTVLFPEVSRRAGSPELASFVRRCLGPLIALSGLVGGLSLLFSLLIPALL